jgi:hypothetical protein
MQRPKNIPKEQLDAFMNKIYIEPVWTFSKKNEKFKLIDEYMNKGALDSFFG